MTTLGLKFSLATRRKMRAAKLGKKPNNFGIPRSERAKGMAAESLRKFHGSHPIRAKRGIAARRKGVQSAENRARRSAEMLIRWSDPAYVEKMRIAMAMAKGWRRRKESL